MFPQAEVQDTAEVRQAQATDKAAPSHQAAGAMTGAVRQVTAGHRHPQAEAVPATVQAHRLSAEAALPAVRPEDTAEVPAPQEAAEEDNRKRRFTTT